MTSKTTTSFPTVGDSVLNYVGKGAATRPNSKYVISVSKETEGRGKSPTGTMASKSNKLREKTGPKCTVVAKLYQANAASAGDQMRNVRLMPSATGISDFWKARSKTGQRY